MKIGDLFCGAGGFSEGFRQAGHDITFAVDLWDRALESHRINHPSTIHIQKDIMDLNSNNLPKIDVLIGSPPCQSFSVQKYVNKNHKEENPGLIIEFMRIVNELEPICWIWENVPAARHHATGPWNMFDAQDYNTPQRRKRVFCGNYPKPLENPYMIKDNIAPTIIAWELCGGWKGNRGRRFSQWLNRKPSWQEMAYYMGFPGGYYFAGNQKDKSIQIGNSVCPPMARAIAEVIKEEGK